MRRMPKVGDSFRRPGYPNEPYQCVAFVSHTRKDGNVVLVPSWQAKCAACKQAFQQMGWKPEIQRCKMCVGKSGHTSKPPKPVKPVKPKIMEDPYRADEGQTPAAEKQNVTGEQSVTGEQNGIGAQSLYQRMKQPRVPARGTAPATKRIGKGLFRD